MIKTMIRAIRRHHAQRLKQKRRFYFGRDLADFPAALGRVLHTPSQTKHTSTWNAAPWRSRKLTAQAKLAM